MSKKKEQEQNSKEPQKERKVKVIYYDDGSTVADMSGTRKNANRPQKQKSTFREKMRTYFAVVKTMITPLLITLAVLTFLYILVMLIAGKFS